MREKKVRAGVCHLCGQWTESLSYEHVPPKKAFNESFAVRTEMERYLQQPDAPFKGGTKLRMGAGAYTLCTPCNNFTGGEYAIEYVRLARAAFDYVRRFPQIGDHDVTICGVRPLRILKQAVTMFFSVNEPTFGDRHPELRRFVLDRHAVGLPPRYDVFLTLVRGGMGRSSAVTGVGVFEYGDAKLVSEVAHFPFALLMTFDAPAPDDTVGRVTHFGTYGLDEIRDVRVRLRAGEIQTPFPGDYRTKEQVEVARSEGNALMARPPEERGGPSAEHAERFFEQVESLRHRMRNT